MRRFCTVIVLTVLVVILGIHTVSFGEMPRSIPVLTDSVMLSEYLADCTQFLSENENKMTAVAFEIMEFAQQNSESFFSIYEEGISVLNSDEIIFAEPEDSNLYPKLCKLFSTVFCPYNYDSNYVEFRQFVRITAQQEKAAYADICLVYTEEKKDASWEQFLILEPSNGGYWYCTYIPYPALYLQ